MALSGPTPERPPQYEFDPVQNALFGELGGKMQFVGMFFTVIGLLALILGVLTMTALTARDALPGVLGMIVSGLLHLAIGVWTRSAGAEFREIVQTKDADITHLMGALTNIRKFYTLMYWMAILTIGLFLVAMVASLLYGPLGAGRGVAALAPGAR